MATSYLREDLEVYPSTFSGEGNEYVVRAGDKYFVVNNSTYNTINLLRESKSEECCIARIRELHGQEVVSVESFVRSTFPDSWLNKRHESQEIKPHFLFEFNLLSPVSTQNFARYGKLLPLS